ncbi:general substrate transporter [Rhexocercosporidium sp. MPI-PUGE-AT-0058]|nr:general substrate transporter [Rhexocercosporidium sp. MPI-PUGE-AT-0058]
MGFSRAPEDRPTPPEVYGYRPYMLTFLACLGSWMFGYNNGVIAGVLVLPSFTHAFSLPPSGTPASNTIIENIVSLLQIGGLVGAMATFPGMKFWGRRVALAVSAGVYTVGAGMQTFSYGELNLMYAGRFITGLGAGGATVVVPLYIAELSPPSIRGTLVGIYEINNQLSSLLGYWCNYLVNEYISPHSPRQYQIPLAMQLIPSILLILASLFLLPESPRFLIKKGRVEKARKVLAYVRHLEAEHEYVNLEVEEIEEAIRREDGSNVNSVAAVTGGDGGGSRKGKWGLVGELWWKGNRQRVLIGMALMAGQNFTGINGVNFYTPTIFRSIGFSGTRVVLLASGMYAAVKTIATIISLVFFIDRLGRRKLLITSSIGTCLSLWYIGAFVTAKHIDLKVEQEKSVAGWVAIVCVYIYAASFSVAWNGVVWVYCAEIFPTRIKELAVCLTTAIQWICQFIVARTSPTMLTNLHGGFFFFFAACITLMGLFVFFFVPETKGRTLEGMDEVFGSAYGELVGGVVEFRDFQRERGVRLGRVKGGVVDVEGFAGRELGSERREVGGDEITRVATQQAVPRASL